MTSATVTAVGLRVEHHEGECLHVDTATPRLSWRVETELPAWRQAAYEIDTGDRTWRAEGRDTVLVPWPGAPLASRARCSWRVRVWGEDGSASDWSAPHRFEIGLLRPEDWAARGIGPDGEEDLTTAQPAAVLRRRFHLDGVPERARLHATALGVYEATLNGERVGDHWLAPGWTAYRARRHVQTFDVTPLLRAGENELVVTVADGWQRGHLGWEMKRNHYGEHLGLIAQLDADGELLLGTDEQWEATTGPVRAADLYNGEAYDARVEPGPWSPVRIVDLDVATLAPQPTPPVRVTQVVPPVARLDNGIIDFGQNLVGVLRITVRGPAGTTVTLRHAEVLEDGELCTRLLRNAQATDTYTLRGDPDSETWSPRFTFHGFRYASVTTDATVERVEALVLHTDMTRTGWFQCSEPLVDRLHENAAWGWRGNTVSVPTDCPQRDERLGWTGDLQVFAPTACYLFDTAGFLDGWLRDLAADQYPDGVVPPVIPNILGRLGACGWSDVATFLPAVLRDFYADHDVVERQRPSMRAWVDWVAGRAGDKRIWTGDFQFGDWVDPTVDPHTPGSARTDPGFVATAYFARSCDLAGLDGLAAEVRDAFRHEWVAPSGRVVADTQTGCAIALRYDMVEEKDRAVVGARLRDLVEREQHRLATGFLGTPALLPALTATGHVDTAYATLLQTRAPGWLYPVTVGATTIWEWWDALRPDGTINEGSEMLSFNHYALGAAVEWLYSSIGGITPLEPGFRRFRVAPAPGPGISWATTRFDSRHGRIESAWRQDDGGPFELRVVVPPNTDAEVVLPDGQRHDAGSGTHEWRA